jgi:maltose operon protein
MNNMQRKTIMALRKCVRMHLMQTAPIDKMLLVYLMISVWGCSVPYEKTISQYQTAPICCASVDKFSFETLRSGDSKSFDLNERSPAYQFLTGKSYFKAFLLPQSSYPYVVTVTSYMLGDSIQSAYIFYPQIITLNEVYKLVRSSDPNSVRLQKAGFSETAKETWGLMYKLVVELPFEESEKHERYLIVLTTNELLGAKTSLSTLRVAPIVWPGLVGAIPVGTKEVLIPHSPVGRINVSLKNKEKGETP